MPPNTRTVMTGGLRTRDRIGGDLSSGGESPPAVMVGCSRPPSAPLNLAVGWTVHHSNTGLYCVFSGNCRSKTKIVKGFIDTASIPRGFTRGNAFSFQFRGYNSQ